MGVPANTVNVLNPTIPIDQSIYEDSSTAKARLGTKLIVGDREFRYARAAAASSLVAGRVSVMAEASTGFCTTTLTLAAASSGQNIVTCTSTSLAAANDFAEGFLYVADSNGEGYMGRIKSNAAGSTGFNVTLYDNLPAALTATSKAGLVPNQYAAVTLTATGKPMGVNPIAVTSSYYFWLQTKGMANVLRADTAAAFAPLKISATAGALSACGTLAATGTASGYTVVGYNHGLPAVDTECSPCIINFD
jgi:hypothetical protein